MLFFAFRKSDNLLAVPLSLESDVDDDLLLSSDNDDLIDIVSFALLFRRQLFQIMNVGGKR